MGSNPTLAAIGEDLEEQRKRRHRKSVFDDYTDEELQKIIDSSCSYHDILVKVGLSERSGNFQTLHRVVHDRNLSYEHLNKNRINHMSDNGRRSVRKHQIPLSEILVEDSTYANMACLKKRLLDEGMLKYQCSICGISEWNGKPLSLQIDHRNGKHTDNSLGNLRLLCPNCHSQTDTFAGRKLKK